MSIDSSINDSEQVLAAALSAILGKEILPESNIPKQSQRHIKKVSLFDQHLTCFVYGKVGRDDRITSNQSFMTLYITILATKTTFPCVIERDASVDKLKQIIYEKEGILRNKQNLIHCGQEIDEGHLLTEYDIKDSSEISVVRLRAINSNDFLVLDKDSWDQMYDYDFTNINDHGIHFTRGSVEYRRPCGWKRYAIKVTGKYEDEVWLGSNNSRNEWPVSYHGTKHDAVNSIAQKGFDLTKHERFAHGRGIYSTPDVNIAKVFAKSFTINAQEHLVILQNRVNPKNLIKLYHDETGNGEYWLSSNAADIRPYGVCIMKKP
ncbi:unnamed protein product [Didymodactylos carnosus]|uniref:Ubiquitin-like domain-containing protein n=1 Tax=Didymodactylos carnosus TaxID=1234261 RepID=A0A815T427_9BILA|nr:unnamed protein product [Didymodactylos carnosus]CAF1502613.1 unnamed protein product [Didymodactylos carnosus]CAF4265897.1 unnamed protein product [Didymodactylos carnosus]CAF4364191.1 unnamed protein product [Didymodactylos carnosus]